MLFLSVYTSPYAACPCQLISVPRIMCCSHNPNSVFQWFWPSLCFGPTVSWITLRGLDICELTLDCIKGLMIICHCVELWTNLSPLFLCLATPTYKDVTKTLNLTQTYALLQCWTVQSYLLCVAIVCKMAGCLSIAPECRSLTRAVSKSPLLKRCTHFPVKRCLIY